MTHKNELAIIREKQLAELRKAMGRPEPEPERFMLDFACAEQDRAFHVTFVRPSGTRVFTCEKVEKQERESPLDRAKGFCGASQSPDLLNLKAGEVNFSSVSCAWCGRSSGWTRCPQCGSFVCGARSQGSSFVCRPGCGAVFSTQPLQELSASRQGGSSSLSAISHFGTKALPPRRR